VIAAITTRGVRTLTELRLITEAGDGCTCCHRELNAYLAIYSSSSSPVICSAK
jgi:NAD(P)H-nitrite reductase large subunit